MKYIVLDTNVILNNAHNIFTFPANTTIVIPETVVDELDSKKSVIGEIGFQAREFGRLLASATKLPLERTESLTIAKFELDDINIHLTSTSNYPDYTDTSPSVINDRKIIEIAKQYEALYGNVTFYSIDVMCRTRAESEGLSTSDFKEVERTDYEYVKTISLDFDTFSNVHNKPILTVDPEYKPENYSYIFTCPDTAQHKLANIYNGNVDVLGKVTETELRAQAVTPANNEQLFLSRAIQDTSIDVIILEALSGSGKAQPLSEPILTPNGWSTMGQIKTNSEVIGSDGLPKRVLGIFPQGIRDVYEVTFIDGTKVRCDKDHLWSVRSRSKGSLSKFEPTTVETMLNTWISKERYDKRYDTFQNVYNYSIEPASPCYYGKDTEDQLIHPYALGLLLGDGSFRGDTVSFTNSSINVLNTLREHIEPAYTLSEPIFRKGAYNVNIIMGTAKESFSKFIEKFGLNHHKSESKFVPKCYLNGTLETRQAVFQGLTDTDGHVKNGKILEYSTSSEQLALDYLELGRSLGKVFTINSRAPKYTYQGEVLEGSLSYRIREMAVKPKSIISINKIGREESQCIAIDSEDHLYITTGYNLTHNTLVSLSNAMAMINRNNSYESILYIRASVNDVPIEEEVGFLPGLEEKFAVYYHPIMDALEHIARKKLSASKLKGEDLEVAVSEEVDKLIAKHRIQCMTGLGMRGRTFTNCIAIIDEVQGQSKASLQKMLTRFGKGCKVIIVGSQRQIDNKFLTKFNNGLSVLLDDCAKESPLIKKFAINLRKVVRSPLSEWAETLFSA